jgi:hypothetical protein
VVEAGPDSQVSSCSFAVEDLAIAGLAKEPVLVAVAASGRDDHAVRVFHYYHYHCYYFCFEECSWRGLEWAFRIGRQHCDWGKPFAVGSWLDLNSRPLG